jgi:hypothetical protein
MLLEALSTSELDQHVTRHWKLLAEASTDSNEAASAHIDSVIERETIVAPFGDQIALRRSRARYCQFFFALMFEVLPICRFVDRECVA